LFTSFLTISLTIPNDKSTRIRTTAPRAQSALINDAEKGQEKSPTTIDEAAARRNARVPENPRKRPVTIAMIAMAHKT
jgi:hypothetical protein